MKHIFYVHSHITFLVSKQYIHEQHINADDCIFFCARKYQIVPKYADKFRHILAYPQDVPGAEGSIFSFSNLKKPSEYIQIVENFVKKLIGEEQFTFYPIGTLSHLACILTTMPQCAGYFIIEEGTSAYKTKWQLWQECVGLKTTLIYTIFRPFFPRLYLLKNHIFSYRSKKYRGTISTSELAFRFMPKPNIVVGTPFEGEELSVVPQAVLSVDGCFTFYKIAPDIIKQIYRELREKLPLAKGATIVYKFHPMYLMDKATMEEVRQIITQEFSDYTLYELSKEIMLENIVKTYRCLFISDFSTVGIYAYQMGCPCLSYASRLVQLSGNKTYRRDISHLPEITQKAYKQI